MKRLIIFLLLCGSVYAGDRYFYIQQLDSASLNDKQIMKGWIKKLDPDIDFSTTKILRYKSNTNITSRITCYDFDNVLLKWNKQQLTNGWEQIKSTLDNANKTAVYVGGRMAWSEDWQE